MRGKIDPSGYGKKKKQPYSHGSMPEYRGDPDSEEIMARDVCSAIWFEVGRSIAAYLEEWQPERDDSKDWEKVQAGMGTAEERWRLHRYGVVRALEVAQNHCDLSDTLPCMVDAFNAGDFEEFEATDEWETATDELEKFMDKVRTCLEPLPDETEYFVQSGRTRWRSGYDPQEGLEAGPRIEREDKPLRGGEKTGGWFGR